MTVSSVESVGWIIDLGDDLGNLGAKDLSIGRIHISFVRDLYHLMGIFFRRKNLVGFRWFYDLEWEDLSMGFYSPKTGEKNGSSIMLNGIIIGLWFLI